MFRDLKEYQEIAKIYTDKVSKPEDLEENQANRMKMKATRDANKPKTREEVGLPPKKKISPFERKFGAEKNEKRLIQSGLKKKIPTTAEIRAKNPNVVPGTRVNEVGAQGGGKPSSVSVKPEVSTMTKQGKPRTKAQMMAAKRIADGKTIADVKQSNQDSMRARAKAKFEAFKKRREEKKAGMSEGVKELTPYDIVLEYLISTEQVATIEEANYVMTEMDGETIRSVVKEFLGGQKGDGYIGHPRLGVENPFSPPKKDKDGKSINTKKTDSSKGLFKSLGNRATDIENMINNPNP